MFSDVIFVVDRIHIKGHVAACQNEYHPDLYKHLKNINTLINETRNSWVSGFRGVVLHMNSMRYHMFFYIIFNEYNIIFIQGKTNYCWTRGEVRSSFISN